MATFVKMHKMKGHISVSYTHLDVYKRQGVYSLRSAIISTTNALYSAIFEAISLSITILLGQFRLGLLFSKSQNFSCRERPSETYLRLRSFVTRSIKGSVPSVSYTHLDVYKRQVTLFVEGI